MRIRESQRPAKIQRQRAFRVKERRHLNSAACGSPPCRAYPAHRRRGRVAEGGGLLNRYRLVKAYRGFESLRLRQPNPSRYIECAERRAVLARFRAWRLHPIPSPKPLRNLSSCAPRPGLVSNQAESSSDSTIRTRQTRANGQGRRTAPPCGENRVQMEPAEKQYGKQMVTTAL